MVQARRIHSTCRVPAPQQLVGLGDEGIALATLRDEDPACGAGLVRSLLHGAACDIDLGPDQRGFGAAPVILPVKLLPQARGRSARRSRGFEMAQGELGPRASSASA